MTRKIRSIGVLVAVPLVLLVATGSGAGAARTSPVLPGTVACRTWSGVIKFSPHLKTTGVSPTETFTITATLGTTASPCVTSLGMPQLGKIKGKLKFSSTGGANRCSTVFSGGALTPTPPSKFKLTWTSPPGSPTHWTQPGPFAVTGAVAMNTITVTGGAVAGSFSPFATPNATLAGPAPWGVAGVTAACGSTNGLASLPLGVGSSGSW
ncbi:MAG TPA: hypothetical protein VN796_01335 [Acidimicrobiales bacterium]|nr:hypothetical protein [Acidimicrobiales bacterium]